MKLRTTRHLACNEVFTDNDPPILARVSNSMDWECRRRSSSSPKGLLIL